MYKDTASEAPLYLVPNSEGTGKRLVRRPHPPPTTAPLPDDFDAITTRAGTTVFGHDDWGVDGSVPDVDYDDMTIQQVTPTNMPAQLRTPRTRRNASPTRSMGPVGALRTGATNGFGKGKANSVAGGMGEAAKAGKTGMASGRYELVQRKVLEDGPERTISIWREGVTQNSDTGEGRDKEVAQSEVDSHAGRRRVSPQSRGPGHSLELSLSGSGASNISPSKRKDRAGRKSIDMTDSPRSPLKRSFSNASSTHRTNMTRTSPSQPASPHSKLPGRREHNPDISDQSTVYTRATSTSSIETVLSSCQPSLLHIAPTLDILGVRSDEHLRALARMREETRDREVKEEALKKGITVVEWAILLDKLQSL